MSTRFVFWRMADGKPDRRDNGNNSPVREILAEFGRISSLSSDGKVSWTGFTYNRLEAALRLAFVVVCPDGEELNESDAWELLRSASIDVIKKVGGKKPLQATDVLKVADSKATEYFRKQESPYVLISSLSVESLPFKSVQVAGCTIEPLSTRRRYPYPDSIRSTGIPAITNHIKSTRYQLVRIRMSGRTAHEATDRAFRALNLLRGLWSLSATFGSWTVTFGGGRRDPIGVIRTGPIHTLHHPDGKLVGNFYWYERAASEDRGLFKPNGGWDKFEKHRRRATHRIRLLSFRTDVEDLIIRYVIALDQADHDVAFLQMWSILEKLTNTIGAKYDETIRKSVWLFSDRNFARELLGCVRLRRNLYVHAARSSEQPDQAAYLIKSFVDSHLVHLIHNDFGVSTLEDYAQHLSFPTDLPTLKKHKRWLEKSIRFLHKLPTTKSATG